MAQTNYPTLKTAEPDIDIRQVFGLQQTVAPLVPHFLYQQGSLFPYEPQDLSEIVWPSTNQFGIPALDPQGLADTLVEPFKIWGESARTDHMPGTYGFYTDDYKFTGLWKHPDQLVQSGCQVAIEPNFSIRPRMPFPVALYELFRKRWLARYWQSQNVKVIIDMNVGWNYLPLNFLGVPKQARMFATRAHKGEHDLLGKVFHLCQQFTGVDEIVFVVYGGGHTVERLCLQHHWQWIPEKMHTQRRAQQRRDYERALETLL
jgi:hypothetical protein